MTGNPHSTICFISILDPWSSLTRNKSWSLFQPQKKEYHGVINDGIEAVWIRRLLGELYFPIEALNIIFCDNKSVMRVVANLIAHRKMKDVDLHARYLRQLVHYNIVKLVHYKANDEIVTYLYEAFIRN